MPFPVSRCVDMNEGSRVDESLFGRNEIKVELDVSSIHVLIDCIAAALASITKLRDFVVTPIVALMIQA